MQKIVEDVLAAEDKAKKVIDDAREKATRIKNNSEQEIGEHLKTAREQAQESIKNEIQKARDAAIREYENGIAEVEKSNAVFIEENSGKIDELVALVSGMITLPEINRE